MARVSTYLNFTNKTEEVFTFYQSIFGGDFQGGITRFKDIPPQPGMPELSETDKNLTWATTVRHLKTNMVYSGCLIVVRNKY